MKDGRETNAVDKLVFYTLKNIRHGRKEQRLQQQLPQSFDV